MRATHLKKECYAIRSLFTYVTRLSRTSSFRLTIICYTCFASWRPCNWYINFCIPICICVKKKKAWNPKYHHFQTTAMRNKHFLFFSFNFPENSEFKSHWTITKLDFWILISEVSNSAEGVGHLLNGRSIKTKLRRTRTTLLLFFSFRLLFSLLPNSLLSSLLSLLG